MILDELGEDCLYLSKFQDEEVLMLLWVHDALFSLSKRRPHGLLCALDMPASKNLAYFGGSFIPSLAGVPFPPLCVHMCQFTHRPHMVHTWRIIRRRCGLGHGVQPCSSWFPASGRTKRLRRSDVTVSRARIGVVRVRRIGDLHF
jgi:hypothetical protein